MGTPEARNHRRVMAVKSAEISSEKIRIASHCEIGIGGIRGPSRTHILTCSGFIISNKDWSHIFWNHNGTTFGGVFWVILGIIGYYDLLG